METKLQKGRKNWARIEEIGWLTLKANIRRGHESMYIQFRASFGIIHGSRSRNRSIEKKKRIIEGFAIDDNVDLHLGRGRGRKDIDARP